jgi:hypothetical protein
MILESYVSYITRKWLVTPPENFTHPKSEVFLLAGRRRDIALLVRKVNVSGQMHIIARGPSEVLAAFSGDLLHKQKDEKWQSNELPVTQEDESELTGGGKRIALSDADGGSDSSGQEHKPPISVDTDSVDTGSSASSRIILEEVKRERQRGEALLAAALEAAAAREAAALEAAAAAAREAAALEAAAARETFIAALMTHAGMTRDMAEKVMRNE